MEDQRQMKASASISCLPREILVKILTGLPAKSAVRFRCSCKFLYSQIPQPRFAFRILVLLPSPGIRPALTLYSVTYSEEISHGRLQAADSAQELDARDLVWPAAGSSCAPDGKLCLLNDETGGGALFDLSKRRRISLPPHHGALRFSIRSSAVVGFDSSSGRYKVFKSAVYYVAGLVLNRQWVLTLGVDISWREIKIRSTISAGYTTTDAAIHIRGIIYFIPQIITEESSKILAMDVATERITMFIPFPPEYQSPKREREIWVKLNGRLAFISINIILRREDDPDPDPDPVESKMEIWTLGIRSLKWVWEWEKRTVLLPLEESEVIGQATSMGFTTNSMGEIVFLLLTKTKSPLILIYSFRRDVWRRIEICGVSNYFTYFSGMGGVVHVDEEIASFFLE